MSGITRGLDADPSIRKGKPPPWLKNGNFVNCASGLDPSSLASNRKFKSLFGLTVPAPVTPPIIGITIFTLSARTPSDAYRKFELASLINVSLPVAELV